MDVEYTGRQVAVTDGLKSLAALSLDRIEKLAGKATSAHVVLTTEKYRHTAEVTVKTRRHDIVGLCESTSMESALRQALEKAEAQAVRGKEKREARKRLPAGDKVSVQPGLERPSKAARSTLPAGAEKPASNGNGTKSAANGMAGRSASRLAAEAEPHVVRSIEAIDLRPMSLEQAVKEAEFRDREVFVFLDTSGVIKVLHRKRDGLMELIELPAL
jgi:putative sigma-54 modulation protein